MDTLQYSTEGGVATLVLNRPQAKNAVDDRMAAELDEALQRIARDDGIRALVLAGAGGAFCAGGDIRGMTAKPERTPEMWRSRMRRLHRVVRALHGLDKPVIAAVDGVAFGAGFSLALLCDVVLVSERARFCMAFGRIGLVPDVAALYTLPRAVGLQRAREIMYSTREIAAAEAVQLGIALELVPSDALMPRARALAEAFTAGSATAIALTKDALQSSLGSSLDAMLEMEAAAQAVAGTSDYHREAVRRFLAKEPSRFQWPAHNAEA